jgi:hypothetical protein
MRVVRYHALLLDAGSSGRHHHAAVSDGGVEAIRAGRSPSEGKYGALSTLARTLIEKRGRIDDQDAERFLAARLR